MYPPPLSTAMGSTFLQCLGCWSYLVSAGRRIAGFVEGYDGAGAAESSCRGHHRLTDGQRQVGAPGAQGARCRTTAGQHRCTSCAPCVLCAKTRGQILGSSLAIPELHVVRSSIPVVDDSCEPQDGEKVPRWEALSSTAIGCAADVHSAAVGGVFDRVSAATADGSGHTGHPGQAGSGEGDMNVTRNWDGLPQWYKEGGFTAGIFRHGIFHVSNSCEISHAIFSAAVRNTPASKFGKFFCPTVA